MYPMAHYLCRLYCSACSKSPFKIHECYNWNKECKGCTWNRNDPTLSIHTCPACNTPATYAQLTDKQRATFQMVCDEPIGSVDDALIQSGIVKCRKDLEACLNHLWNKTDSMYPLMLHLLQNILEGMEELHKTRTNANTT